MERAADAVLVVLVAVPVLVSAAAARKGAGTGALKIAIGVLCAGAGQQLLLAATEDVAASAPGSSTHGLVFVFLPIWCAVGVGVLCVCHLVGRSVGDWMRNE